MIVRRHTLAVVLCAIMVSACASREAFRQDALTDTFRRFAA